MLNTILTTSSSRIEPTKKKKKNVRDLVVVLIH